MARFRISGEVLVFMGAFCWSLCSPIVKFLEMDTFLILAMRSVFAFAALAAFIRPKRLNWNGWMLAYLCSYTAVTIGIVSALTMTSSAIALGLQNTALIWLSLLVFFRTKRFEIKLFAPVIVILVGVALFMSTGTGGSDSLGNLIALAGGVAYAGMTLSAGKAAGDNPIGLTAIANLFSVIVIVLLFPGKLAGIAEMRALDWGIIAVSGIVQVGGGYTFYNMGLRSVSPQKASIIALWEMVMGPLWVAIFLGEFPTVIEVIALAVIMLGIVMDAKLNAAPDAETSAE